MATHTISLPEELDSFVTESVASGDYPDAGSVMRDALRALRREDQLKLKALIAAIDEGEASGVFEGDPFESVRQEMGWTAEIYWQGTVFPAGLRKNCSTSRASRRDGGGSEQAFKYLRELRAAFTLLAERPKLGRLVHKKYPGKRRMEMASHVVFFREEADGIFVQRILHKQRMSEL